MNTCAGGDASAGSSAAALYRQSYALVVGESNYKHWPRLPGAARDVNEVEKVLKSHGFAVRVLMDPTRKQFDEAVSDFKSKYDRSNPSRFLFYFTGHGHTLKTDDGRELGYIVTSDAPLPNKDPGGFQASAISMVEMETLARIISTCHALFVFDSCFSGSVFTTMRGVPEGITARTSEPVRLFVAAGTAQQKVPDESIFRAAFVKALGGDADRDKDGYVTGSELGEFLLDNVSKYSNGAQTPRYGKIRDPRLDGGDFVFMIQEPERFQPFYLESQYYPLGMMGDLVEVETNGKKGTGQLAVSLQSEIVEGRRVAATRIEYRQGKTKGWAGVYWQHPDKNWGDQIGYSLAGAKRITFYARGERGDEIVEFISGGINDKAKPYHDRFKKSLGRILLTNKWTKYAIDLSNLPSRDLSSVIGAFAWMAAGGYDKGGRLVTYLAELKVE